MFEKLSAGFLHFLGNFDWSINFICPLCKILSTEIDGTWHKYAPRWPLFLCKLQILPTAKHSTHFLPVKTTKSHQMTKYGNKLSEPSPCFFFFFFFFFFYKRICGGCAHFGAKKNLKITIFGTFAIFPSQLRAWPRYFRVVKWLPKVSSRLVLCI